MLTQRIKEAEEKRKADQARELAEEKKREEEEEFNALSPEEQKAALDAKAALVEKDLGNGFYSKKKFTEALAHYDAAIALDATNPAFLTNKAAVFHAQRNYDGSIETCQQALKVSG